MYPAVEKQSIISWSHRRCANKRLFYLYNSSNEAAVVVSTFKEVALLVCGSISHTLQKQKTLLHLTDSYISVRGSGLCIRIKCLRKWTRSMTTHIESRLVFKMLQCFWIFFPVDFLLLWKLFQHIQQNNNKTKANLVPPLRQIYLFLCDLILPPYGKDRNLISWYIIFSSPFPLYLALTVCKTIAKVLYSMCL